MTGGGSSAALGIGSAFMTDLGSLFPARMSLTGDELEFTFVLSGTPPGDVSEWARLRSGAGLAGRVPRFFVDAGGRRLRVELTGTAVGALIVPSADLAPAAVNAPHLGRWQDRITTSVQLAVDEIARMLARCRHRAGGTEPLIDLELAYEPDREYRARSEVAHEQMRGFLAPVRPVLELRWRSATPPQRKAFLDELPDAAPARRWFRRSHTTSIMGLEVELVS
ncbi:hypothetical protein VSH64_10860 [Amycolatopsis rhabdoformis]|uniref:Uncharacterized protein n=1 Tax=Amycolatopsis rhabdoformis TaxID=1448059 RepID=A0ABZ1IFS9_9PSEU|nr:hypothetical protein [Amycolatopsis rhabdoformis]WSE32606.1 hypothetical protein VSH64_10860 [Amycolatopsis rhabdoformis]